MDRRLARRNLRTAYFAATVALLMAVGVGSGADIISTDTSGAGVKRLTQHEGANTYAACSPDGRLIAFFSTGKRKAGAAPASGHDDSGAYFWASYGTLESAVESVEAYLEAPLGAWVVNHYPPEPPSDVDRAASGAAFKTAIRTRSLALPKGATFTLRGSFWVSLQEAAK